MSRKIFTLTLQTSKSEPKCKIKQSNSNHSLLLNILLPKKTTISKLIAFTEEKTNKHWVSKWGEKRKESEI